MMQRRLRERLAGSVAGLFATGTMSAVLGIADMFGIMNQQPPRRIVAWLLPVRPRSNLTNGLAIATHLGYGIAGGVAFSYFPPLLRRSPRTGACYGVLIYAAGYEGWLPLLGILPPAHRDNRRRVATMIVSHLVYGASLSYANRVAARRS